MGYSQKCPDQTTYFDQRSGKCLACAKPDKGRELSPNCGRSDTGGKHEPSTRPCPHKTFNDGKYLMCQTCTQCQTGFITVSNCTTTADTRCLDLRKTTQVPVTEATDAQDVSAFTKPSTVWTPLASDTLPTAPHPYLRMVPLILVICMLLVVLSTWLICRRRKRGQNMVLNFVRRSSLMSAGFSPLSAPAANNDLEDFLSPNIFSAPLQSVLDNLDVLEELVILLDPETQGVKNTKHLASLCSFPFTWITYTYSMRESKSPLKAVLEGVTSRHPEWTVGHLAKLLWQMERNDAINVLTKLKQNETDA
ncbi:IGF-like family receptor 1 isoform X2 [Sphaeramia orbicularis]|uniref:IGF-like family receptor 1 isoform X2 n=1 Tax=Sphaeramia orbicularis TaxID=375764 RepID=UPI00117E4902|nr:IGF-like family receptor 1 isoform X2 [Sphaeramia orbicularis]